jgi:hypothetical protein
LWTMCWKNIYLMWIDHTRTVFINLKTTVMHYSSSKCVLIIGPIFLAGNIRFLLLLVKSLGIKKPMNNLWDCDRMHQKNS